MEDSAGPAATRWRETVERRQRQMDAAYAAIGRTSADYWTRRIGNRPSMLQHIADPGDPTMVAMRPFLSTSTTVLDVGAGAGRYALALAPHVASVVAVEPDKAMVPRLESAIRETGAGNVTILQSSWQDAQVAPADVALCAHVLYPIANAVAFVRKLDACARRARFIVLRDVVAEPEPLGRLWAQFHHQPRYLQPGYADAFDLLYELGIRANVCVSVVPGPTWSFETLDDAVAGVREHLILRDSPETNAELSRELTSALQESDGMLRLSVSEAHVGVLWWEK